MFRPLGSYSSLEPAFFFCGVGQLLGMYTNLCFTRPLMIRLGFGGRFSYNFELTRGGQHDFGVGYTTFENNSIGTMRLHESSLEPTSPIPDRSNENKITGSTVFASCMAKASGFQVQGLYIVFRAFRFISFRPLLPSAITSDTNSHSRTRLAWLHVL